MFSYAFDPKSEKEINRLPADVHQRILDKLKQLCQLRHPMLSPHVKKLAGYAEPTYRLQIGSYRVKFMIRGQSLLVVKVFHRQAGY